MIRVGEEIRIMDIYHDPLSMFGGTSGEGEHVFFVAPTRMMVHPYAEPNGVHAVLAQQFNTISAFQLPISKRNGVPLHLTEPTDVASFCPRPARTVGLVITSGQ